MIDAAAKPQTNSINGNSAAYRPPRAAFDGALEIIDESMISN